MSEEPLARFIMGGLFILLGLVIILIHTKFWVRAKKLRDTWGRTIYGERWTGKYTRGGELFLRGFGALFGSFCLVEGLLVLFKVVY